MGILAVLCILAAGLLWFSFMSSPPEAVFPPVVSPHPPANDISESGPWNVPVLVISYIPLKQGNVDISLTRDWNNPDIGALRQKIKALSEGTAEALTKASVYHGYKREGVPSLNYSIVESKEFLKPILRTQNQDWDFIADHLSELSALDVCNYVDNKGIKEVWIFMYHNDPPKDSNGNSIKDSDRYYVVPTESNMAMGTEVRQYWNYNNYGDISNSFRFNDLPTCIHTYTVYEYNYGREIGEALHDHGHQLEALFHYADNSDEKPAGADGLFWKRLVGSEYKDYLITVPHCGWIHYPPNAQEEGYSYESKNKVWSDCENWNPDGTGEKEYIGCEKWSCTQEGFIVWWMQNIPGKGNNLSFEGKQLRNWWEFVGDFDMAIAKGKTLVLP